ncbi:MAG: hypothetical protein GW795_04205 [Cyanobacteria bacterium]|nr:hypothetical protein [Cyanobacteria bacterium CG_2015-16_32_12]NCO78865.1 hypothetical protein [Cyanobacteria bacterium CG_2015-22_32_23]NCQ05106.1 hypothetical protein [Cyanobacteria bacterium CG_2015-09_32_10]NCQ41097.1 hypothetical protein [Cyanobacteria bacterium CG_2015-04_32_10]NCS85787.1 hypothetical protein [Cyanobacteria bacterium CG_2015-02_32_10]
MQPKFKDIKEYEKAQLLLQPIYIRLIDNLRQQSELLSWDISYEEITKPFPAYIVCLKKGNYISKNNIWELCFQVCFDSYKSGQIHPVETDKNLIDDDGELDWQQLDFKTKILVKSLFISE